MMPPFSLVNTLKVPVRSSRLAMSPTIRVSRNEIASFPCNIKDTSSLAAGHLNRPHGQTCAMVLLNCTTREQLMVHRLYMFSYPEARPAHVRDIEQGSGFSAVDAGIHNTLLVLNGHRPASKRYHFPCKYPVTARLLSTAHIRKFIREKIQNSGDTPTHRRCRHGSHEAEFF